MASGLGATGRVSKRLILSYIIDWIVIIAIAAVGAVFSVITPNKRPFDVADPTISFPYVVKEKISTGTLVIVGLVVPAIIIFIITLFIGLGPSTGKTSSTAALRRKLWEWNAGWMGLGVALAVAFFISNGTKNLVGKPRPDMLARCDPDLSRTLNSTVGGIGTSVDEGINLVSWIICRNPGPTLDDGFRSFPSGHSTFSFAGLTYLALFVCAKFAITIPFLNYNSLSHRTDGDEPSSARTQAAAPPTYLLIFPLIPISAAIYISSTRYSDFYHHGFDIIAGSIIGIFSAWLGFRWYHLPISRGGGWAWAPRSYDRAFGRGIGILTYGNDNGYRDQTPDIEHGTAGGQGYNGQSMPFQPKTSEGSAGFELGDMGDVRGYGPGRASDSSRRPLR